MLTSVTSALAGSSVRARTLSASITVPPEESGRKISNTERSKAIEVAASTAERSASENTPWAQRTRRLALAWAIPTALGRPVEPEV